MSSKFRTSRWSAAILLIAATAPILLISGCGGSSSIEDLLALAPDSSLFDPGTSSSSQLIAHASPTAAANSAVCTGIIFQNVRQYTVGSTSRFFGLQRQADGSFTRLTYSVNSSPTGLNKIGTQLNAQQPAIDCAGLPSRTRHIITPNLKLDPIGSESRDPVVTDLVGDGSIAVLGMLGITDTTQLTVQLGSADGTPKGSPVSYTVGPQAVGVLTGDFNGDGKKDVAVIFSGSSTTANTGGVSILLGNGDGTLKPAVNYITGNGAEQGVAFDFNGDGRPDIAVGHYSPANVTMLLSQPDGSMKIGTSLAVAAQYPVGSLAAGDVNGDRKADLVAFTHGSVIVYKGNGNGTFQAGSTIAVPANDATLGLGDFNNDGLVDIALNEGDSGILYLLPQTSSGAFTAPVSGFSTGGFGSQFFVEDFDGDGNLDVALASGHPDALTNPFGFLRIGILFGNGDGTFASGSVVPVNGDPFDQAHLPFNVAIADFNGDGKLDLATANPTTKDVSVSLNRGAAVFGAAVNTSLGNIKPNSIVAGDFDGDGKADLIVSDGVANVQFLSGKGDGTFQLPFNVPVNGTTPSFVVSGDFDGNKKLDIAVVNSGSNNVSILLNNGTFQTPSIVNVGPNPVGIVTGDFNGDGKLDLAVANGGTFSASGTNLGSISVLLGKGDGTFQSAVSYTAYQYPVFITAADVTGDQKLDLIVASRGADGNDKLVVLPGTGSGTFQAGILTSTLSGPTAIAAADFSGDGKADLMVAHCCGYRATLTSLAGNGDGSFQAEREVTRGSFSTLAARDLNGDGKQDIVYTNFALGGTHTVGTLLNITIARGNLTITSAAGNPLKIPPIAPDSIDTAKGSGLATTILVNPAVAPPDTLGGTSGTILDSAGVTKTLGMFYVSPTQVNFYVPAGVATGTATVTTTASDGFVSVGTVQVAKLAPAIFTLNSASLAAAYVQRVHGDTSQSIENLYAVDAAGNVTFPGIDLGPSTDQVYLNIYGTGFRGRSSLAGITIYYNGVPAPAASTFYAGPSTYPGEDQLVVLLPRSLQGAGTVQIRVVVDGLDANPTTLNVK